MKNINKRCLAIAGAAVLFLGLPGNVHANPFPLSRSLDSGISSTNTKSERGDLTGDRTPGRNDVGHLQPDAAWYTPCKENAVPVKSCSDTSQVPNPISNVPDGGGTALMVGIAMAGLFIMKKKQSA